jgi:hypothetical protein
MSISPKASRDRNPARGTCKAARVDKSERIILGHKNRDERGENPALLHDESISFDCAATGCGVLHCPAHQIVGPEFSVVCYHDTPNVTPIRWK